MVPKKETDSILWSEMKKGVVVAALNRPQRRNALSYDTLRALADALCEMESRPEIRVIILTGTGGHFCGGLDLREAFAGGNLPLARKEAFSFFGETIPSSLIIDDSPENRMGETVLIPKSFQMPRLVVEILYRLARLPQIVIGAASGGAIGGGGGLLSVCDLAIADETLLVGFPEDRRGLAPTLLHPFLSRRITAAALGRLLLTGAPVRAEEALRMGIIQEIIPGGSVPLLHRVSEIADAVLAGEPEETVETKRLLNGARIPPLGEMTDGLIRHWQSWNSPKAQEGIAAFLEKRSPVW